MNVCFHILLFVVVRVLCGYSLSASVRSILCSSTESVYMNLIYDIDLDMICYMVLSRSILCKSDLCSSVGSVLYESDLCGSV